jgi:hypothetical protein
LLAGDRLFADLAGLTVKLMQAPNPPSAAATSGAKVVLVTLGGVVAVAIFVVAAFLLTDTNNLRCVEGELQDNALRPDGSVLPRIESFETIEDAEAFICRRIPHPLDTGDLILRRVHVARQLNLGKTIEGEGGASIEFEYELDYVPQLRLQVAFPPQDESEAVEGPTVERITLRGVSAFLQSIDAGTRVVWTQGDFSYFADARTGFDRATLLRILESIR